MFCNCIGAVKDGCYTCLLLGAKVNSQCVQMKTYGLRFLLDTLEQSLLFHLTCSIAHSCCSRTFLRKL